MKTTLIVLIIFAMSACQPKNENGNESENQGNNETMILEAENEEFSAYINHFKQTD